MTISMRQITTAAQAVGVPVYEGYAPSNAKLPYVVNRPLLVTAEDPVLCGSALDWDTQFTLYACAGGVEASYNLAVSLMQALQGQRVGDSTLSVSMGYSGAQVEGHYESQVTVQSYQGGI